MVQTLLMDLDDTLLDFRASEREAVSRTLTELGLSPTRETVELYHTINRDMWQSLERGEVTREEVLVRRFELLFSALGVKRDPQETKALYEARLGESSTLLPGAVEVLELLGKRYSLYLVSNGTAAVQDRRLARSGLLPYFDGVFISERVGYVKPDPRFFDRVFDALGEDRRVGSVVVGDSLTSDIAGGIGAGLRTLWISHGQELPSGAPRPTATVSSLSELPRVLETLF